MFKLPICPYCHTVYSYKDVKINKESIIKCYHCKNKFSQNKIKCFFILTIIIMIAVAINIIILNSSGNLISSIIPVTIVSVTAVVLYMILTPYFTEYKKLKNIELREIPDTKITEEYKIKQKKSVKIKNKKNNK